MLNFIIGIASSAFAGLILHFVLLYKWNDYWVRIKIFERSKIEQFYDLLRDSISSARSDVIQFAEGFDATIVNRKQKAEQYVNWIQSALRKNEGLSWKRIQTANPFDGVWFDMLREVKDSYKDQFDLYYYNNLDGSHLVSIVLIDPHHPRGKVFLLLSKQDFQDNRTIRAADTGIMIQGSGKLSSTLYDSLTDMCQSNDEFIFPILPDTTADEVRGRCKKAGTSLPIVKPQR